MGWMGSQQQVMDTLAAAGADRDEDGRFLIQGGGVTSFMGVDDPNNDDLVDDQSLYRANGRWSSLANLLCSTGLGLGSVKVI